MSVRRAYSLISQEYACDELRMGDIGLAVCRQAKEIYK
jgi:hypothetical protein